MVEQSAIAGITGSTLCMNGSKTTSHRSIKRWSISSLDFIWCFRLGLVSLWCTLTKSQRSDSNIFWGLLDGNLHLTRRRRTAASWASRDDSLPKSCSHSDQWSMQMSVEREREREREREDQPTTPAMWEPKASPASPASRVLFNSPFKSESYYVLIGLEFDFFH